MPILNALIESPQKLFALILTPTRELAFQISEQFEALGASIGLYVCKFFNFNFFFPKNNFIYIILATIVGGIDMTMQALSLAKRPHVIVGLFFCFTNL